MEGTGDEMVLRARGYGSQVSLHPVRGVGAMRLCQFVRLASRRRPNISDGEEEETSDGTHS